MKDSAADASASKPSVQCTLQHFHKQSCLPCPKRAPSRPARDELVNDDRGPMVHTCEQRRVLHVELALLLCRRLSWWIMGSTRKRHHEPAGAPGLDEKEPDWIKHQGHDFLSRQSVGHLILLGKLREYEKFPLWRIIRPIQRSWWWTGFHVDPRVVQ